MVAVLWGPITLKDDAYGTVPPDTFHRYTYCLSNMSWPLEKYGLGTSSQAFEIFFFHEKKIKLNDSTDCFLM